MTTMKKKEALSAEHKKFRDQYRGIASSEWQTFRLGLNAGWEAAIQSRQAAVPPVLQLPNDEEIEKAASERQQKLGMGPTIGAAFYEGAVWMRSKMSGGNDR